MEEMNATRVSFPVTSPVMTTNSGITWDTTHIDVTTEKPSDVGNNTANVTSQWLNDTEVSCMDWDNAQHVLFQLGCVGFVAGCMIPFTLASHALLSRGSLAIGALLMLLWGGTVVCHQDVLVWYIIFCIVNTGHCVMWVYHHWPVRIPHDLEDVYCKMYKPLKMSRGQFRELARLSQIKHLPNGATYALEGATHIGQKLSILLSGRLKVTCDNLFLHSIEPGQFVDSVEYDALALDTEDDQTTECFQVTIRAIDDSQLVTWETEFLRHFLLDRPYFASVMTHVLGKDITHKLYQVQEMLLSHPQYIRVLANRNSISHFRHNMPEFSPSSTHGNLNGILRHSPPGSFGSSFGSRTTASPTRILVTSPTRSTRSPSQLSLETSV